MGMGKARQKKPSPSLWGEASQLLRGFAGSSLVPYSEVGGGVPLSPVGMPCGGCDPGGTNLCFALCLQESLA